MNKRIQSVLTTTVLVSLLSAASGDGLNRLRRLSRLLKVSALRQRPERTRRFQRAQLHKFVECTATDEHANGKNTKTPHWTAAESEADTTRLRDENECAQWQRLIEQPESGY